MDRKCSGVRNILLLLDVFRLFISWGFGHRLAVVAHSTAGGEGGSSQSGLALEPPSSGNFISRAMKGSQLKTHRNPPTGGDESQREAHTVRYSSKTLVRSVSRHFPTLHRTTQFYSTVLYCKLQKMVQRFTPQHHLLHVLANRKHVLITRQ